MTSGEVVAASKPIVTAAAKPAMSWLRRKLRPDISESALDAAAAQLAGDVARIERTRLDQLQVSPGTGIPLQFSDLAAVMTIGPDAPVRGSLPEVAPYYQALRVPRRLLVVGEAGSGKTVLILHLILDLLDSRRVASDPVPVRINATSWDGTANLTDLLVEKLRDQYALHKRTARALVDSGRILPIIDGLDEMDATGEKPNRAQAAVTRFNESPWRGRSMVVTCRSQIYEAIRTAQDGAGISRCETMSMRPLNSGEIAEHVQTLLDDAGRISVPYGRRLAPLLEELAARPTGVLAHALRTPWMFTLAMAYLEQAENCTAVALLEADTSAAITDVLFAAQIPTACRNQPGEASTWSYSEHEVQNWMRALARHLSGEPSSGVGKTEAALHQVWLLAGERRTKRLHGCLAGLTAGLTAGSALGLATRPAAGVIFGLAIALTFALTPAAMPGPQRVVLRTHRKGALRARLLIGLTFGLATGLVFGLTAGLASGLFLGPRDGVVFGVTLSLATGLAVGLVFGLTAVPTEFRPPREGKHEILDDLLAGLIGGLVGGLVAGMVLSLAVGVAGGLAIALMGALVSGLSISNAAWRYASAALIFRRTGVFAARPVKFLEWAVAAGLLRITGTAYQFRHETYREWLTTHPAPATE